MGMYSTLLWDADETLFDFRRAMKHSMEMLLTHIEVPFSQETIDTYERINIRYWQRLELGEIDRQEVCEGRFREFFKTIGYQGMQPIDAHNYFMENLSKSPYVIDGAIETLKALQNSFDLNIVTNGTAYVQERRLRESGVGELIHYCYISENIGYEKPDTRFFQAVLEDIEEKDTSKILVIGDSISSDMKGGILAGLDTCWYNPFHKSNESEWIPTYEADCWEKIFAILGYNEKNAIRSK